MNIYSDWFKVDLHIHTDFSKKTKTNDYQGHFDINVLKQKLLDNDIKLFSLTDHNIINVDAYENYYTNFKAGDPELLIGCEFDIEVPESGTPRTYHSVIIFDNNSIDDVKIISKKIEDLYIAKRLLDTDRKIVIDDLYDLFNEFNFFFIPHAGNTKSILDPYRGYDMKLCQQMVLLMPSAFEKVKESVRQKYNEGFDLLKSFDFQEKDDIPYINFSDNHNCDRYPCTNKDGDDHEFYCIKGQPTFESIRFAFIDPKSRIKKYSEVEVLKRFDNFLHSIEIKNNKLIEDANVFFSPNLNVIIGGRSSGKSLLFNILGNKIGNSKSDLNKYTLDVSDIKIKSFLDTDYKSSITYNLSDVIYINQGDIVNYFENNSLKDLIKESGKSEEYKFALEYFKGEKNGLSELVDKLIDLYSELIDSLNSNFTLHHRDIESIFDTSYFFKAINNVENKKETFDKSSELLNELLNNIDDFKVNENWELIDLELKLVDDFKKLVTSKKNDFDIVQQRHLSKGNLIRSVNEIIKSKNETLDLKGREKESSNHRLRLLKDNIFDLFDLLKRFQDHCLLIDSYSYNFSKEININNEVTVVLEIENQDNINKKIFDGLNFAGLPPKSVYDSLVKLANSQIKIKNFPDNSPDNLRKKIVTLLGPIHECFDKPMEYLKYSEDSSSKNNSPGFNSEKYLETILKNGNSKIVFIDQPEDNLGNRFITNNLIDIIRDLKFKKEIFLVTHNPSIVVYGDAENIIMCTNDENKVKYQQFVLEEKVHQKEICEVLDGGHYIFDQRARKYNIKKLIQS
ncbi:hypothetical protein [Pedobacter jamesrossensis]|uniref:DNA repair protein RecN n=1 Tax=Pedobacter jamesrossensis TaxID=1908238 RepID=A0ABV8NIU0_9SPHI